MQQRSTSELPGVPAVWGLMVGCTLPEDALLGRAKSLKEAWAGRTRTPIACAADHHDRRSNVAGYPVQFHYTRCGDLVRKDAAAAPNLVEIYLAEQDQATLLDVEVAAEGRIHLIRTH